MGTIRCSGRSHGGLACERFEVLHDGREVELVTRTGKTSQADAFKAMIGLQVSEAFFDSFAFIAGMSLRLHECTRDVSRVASLRSGSILGHVTFGQHRAFSGREIPVALTRSPGCAESLIQALLGTL